jgi:hypothetical protein
MSRRSKELIMESTPVHIDNVFKPHPGHHMGGDGFGFGGGGLGGGLVGGLLASTLFGNRNNGADAALVTAQQTSQLMSQSATETLGLVNNGAANTASVVAAIDTSAQTAQNYIVQGFGAVGNRLDALTASGTAGFQATLAGIGAVKDDICQVRFENAQQTNQLLQAMCANTQAINASIQSVKDQNTAFEIKDLERQLAVAQTGGPIVRAGAFVPINPCASAPDHTAAINQLTQIAIGTGNALNAIQAALAK